MIAVGESTLSYNDVEYFSLPSSLIVCTRVRDSGIVSCTVLLLLQEMALFVSVYVLTWDTNTDLRALIVCNAVFQTIQKDSRTNHRAEVRLHW